tara:strand:+ start:26 stop:328 length:303 start_codon:yes stop_codon:yes gene_type:complete
MANRCFLFASNSTSDSVSVDSDRVTDIEVSSATAVSVNFTLNDGADGSIALTVTEGKAERVSREIGRLVLSGRGVIVLGDDVNGIYGVDGIESVGTITHS